MLKVFIPFIAIVLWKLNGDFLKQNIEDHALSQTFIIISSLIMILVAAFAVFFLFWIRISFVYLVLLCANTLQNWKQENVKLWTVEKTFFYLHALYNNSEKIYISLSSQKVNKWHSMHKRKSPIDLLNVYYSSLPYV